MLKEIIRFSIKQRWLVLLITLGLALWGIYNLQYLAIDAVPDITNVQVQINTEATGYSPYEVEQRITHPIEIAMSGLPSLEYTRSLSRYGLSQVTVIFKNNTDIYFARQLINERLQEIKNKLPPNVESTLGPISTGLGEIFMYTVVNKVEELSEKLLSPTELRTIQDWIIKPKLRNTSGVAEVNTIGGFEKQYHVTPDPRKLLQYNLSLDDVALALIKNNSNVGAGYIEKNGEQYLVRVPGQITDFKEIYNIVVESNIGTPVYIKDIATVSFGKELRTGAATQNGNEVVLGTVFMLMGENSREVSNRVNDKLSAINKTLPKGTEARVVYNRTDLVNATINTVRSNLIEGALLVCAILFFFLGNIRAALITAAVIPLSMLVTITGMVTYKISANLMSLGALDFGLLVDGAVILVENSVKQLAYFQAKVDRPLTLDERLTVTENAAIEVIRPSIFGVFIITFVYLPILTLSGIEGKMFLPMAQTVIIALLAALFFTLTFVPAATAIFLGKNIKDHKNRLMLFLTAQYQLLLKRCIDHHRLVIAAAGLLVIACAFITASLGGEFIPSLDEGDVAMHAMRVPGTSLSQSIQMQDLLEKRLIEFPQVKLVFSKIGTAEVATDPMPPNVADVFIMMKPRSQWPDPKLSKSELVHALEQAVSEIPGNNYEFTQPIQMRFNELISGVRGDVAIKIFGDDMNMLSNIAASITKVLQSLPGSADIKVEQVAGLPILTVEIDRKALSRYGLQLSNVQSAIEIAFAGIKSGQVYESDKRFDIVLRLPEPLRNDPFVLRNITVPIPIGADGERHFIPLSEIASLKLKEGPNQISRENGKRRLVISLNVRDRDLTSFITDAKKRIETTIQVPSEYWLEWGGQFEQLQSAMTKLKVVVPITLALILLFLFFALRNIIDALLVFTGIPLALTGGVISLWLRGIPLSISAGVGFIALSGIAVLNGLVMISFINKLIQESNIKLKDAVYQGSIGRLRPVLMTALVASLGFLPMALAAGTGSEVQRPLATVVIGGILSSTFLTLLVLPGLYYMIHEFYSKRRRPKSNFSS